MVSHIRFIGFGEAARAFVDTLSASEPLLSFSAYDILLGREGPDGPLARAAKDRGVGLAPSAVEGLDAADWVILAVTADSSFEAAQSVASKLTERHLVIDINSVSPARKRATAALVEAQEADYLDMAVMAPVAPGGHRTPVLVAGASLDRARPALDRLDFRFEEIGPEPGGATAIKMVRSVFVKGLEALTAQTLLAAKKSGCYERVVASLSRSFSGLGWPDFPTYQIERMTTHGIRRAAEMRESAATLDELGLQGDLVREIAKAQETLGRIGTELAGEPGTELGDGGLETTLDRLVERLAPAGATARRDAAK